MPEITYTGHDEVSGTVWIVKDDYDHETVAIVIGALLERDAIAVVKEQNYDSVKGDLYAYRVYTVINVTYK